MHGAHYMFRMCHHHSSQCIHLAFITTPCNAYATESEIPVLAWNLSLVRFRFDGNPVKETDTPEGLEMEDEDTIDVFQSQTGGYFEI